MSLTNFGTGENEFGEGNVPTSDQLFLTYVKQFRRYKSA